MSLIAAIAAILYFAVVLPAQSPQPAVIERTNVVHDKSATPPTTIVKLRHLRPRL